MTEKTDPLAPATLHELADMGVAIKGKYLREIADALNDKTLKLGERSAQLVEALRVGNEQAIRLSSESNRADNAEMASGAAYQAVGSLASDFDVFDHPLIQKLMTVLSRQEEHEDLLPWPSKSLEEWRQEARDAPENVEHLQMVGDVEKRGQNCEHEWESHAASGGRSCWKCGLAESV